MTVAELVECMNKFDMSTDQGLFIFADWLEEQGEPDWAYLCRIYSEHARKLFEFCF